MKVTIGLLVVFLIATQGCGPQQALYNPNVDQAQMRADQRKCEEDAKTYGDSPMLFLRRPGSGEGINEREYYESCMERKGYRWVDEKDVPR